MPMTWGADVSYLVAAAVDAERLEESDRHCVRRLLAGVVDHPTGRTALAGCGPSGASGGARAGGGPAACGYAAGRPPLRSSGTGHDSAAKATSGWNPTQEALECPCNTRPTARWGS